MTKHARISYFFVVLTIAMAVWLRLATPFLTIFFCYFALQKLSFGRNKFVGLVLFSMLAVAAGYGSYFFLNQAVHAFPRIAENAIPAVIKFAKEHDFKLPFTDLDSLKTVAVETVVEEIRALGKQATLIGKLAVQMLIGLVVAVSLFVNERLELDGDRPIRNNLYSLVVGEVVERFRSLYRSFATVMGAQLIISAINTAATAIFVYWVKLPYSELVIAVTFFCGLLPIIGNIISNTVIVSIAFTLEPKLGLIALAFLVALHKSEYFLNSKIIGTRIKNPMWLTLLALVLAERLMGIPGMILAPVMLHYVRVEASKIRVTEEELVEQVAA